jgi:hypothetical protein
MPKASLIFLLTQGKRSGLPESPMFSKKTASPAFS